MLAAIFIKEWLKIRWYWLVALALNLAILGYLWVSLRHQFNTEHSEMIYYWVFELRRLLFTPLKYVPAVTGLIIALAQFLPEMAGGRFRLSLHLPLRSDLLVGCWVAFGAAAGGVIALMVAAGLFAIVGIWFPQEGAVSAVKTALPWLLGGWVTYFSTALTLMEPSATRRLIYAGLGFVFLALLYQERGYQEYDAAMPVLMLMALLLLPAVVLPAHRYRHRS